jgi:hypothetical protein
MSKEIFGVSSIETLKIKIDSSLPELEDFLKKLFLKPLKACPFPNIFDFICFNYISYFSTIHFIML